MKQRRIRQMKYGRVWSEVGAGQFRMERRGYSSSNRDGAEYGIHLIQSI